MLKFLGISAFRTSSYHSLANWEKRQAGLRLLQLCSLRVRECAYLSYYVSKFRTDSLLHGTPGLVHATSSLGLFCI